MFISVIQRDVSLLLRGNITKEKNMVCTADRIGLNLSLPLNVQS